MTKKRLALNASLYIILQMARATASEKMRFDQLPDPGDQYKVPFQIDNQSTLFGK